MEVVPYNGWTNNVRLTILEIESLGPLVTLAPGESTSHEERWELHRGVPACRNEADVEKHLLPRLVSG